MSEIKLKNWIWGMKRANNKMITFNRLEWGSVQTKPASTSCTSLNPFNRFKHKESNSRDSNVQATHSVGGSKYLSIEENKFLQKSNEDYCFAREHESKLTNLE